MAKKKRLPASKQRPDPASADADEKSLFREAMSGVTPLATPNRVAVDPSHRRSIPKNAPAETTNKPATDSGDPQPLVENWLRPGHSPAITKALRGRAFTADDQLDLHQLKADQARRQLRRFLDQADRDQSRRLRIIHGRGLHSPGRAVLPELVQDELRLDPRVLAFRLAGRFDGGAGAVRVLFKPSG
ncbi:MAG: Smr/MutS family protein [Gammaproteobacteria bacterium]